MRTTIEMRPDHRARLLELAASRGEKGISVVVAEALDQYLDAQRSRARQRKAALAMKGSMGAAEADRLRARTREIRMNWR